MLAREHQSSWKSPGLAQFDEHFLGQRAELSETDISSSWSSGAGQSCGQCLLNQFSVACQTKFQYDFRRELNQIFGLLKLSIYSSFLHTVEQEIFVRNLISSLSSKQFFDKIKFLTKLFHKPQVWDQEYS